MALRTPLTAQPHLYIGDSTGRPLDYGRVYFGEPNKDPEFYPIDIYLDPEMTIAAAQPVRTKGGFMDVGGNLAELHAAEVVYSLKVLDQYGRQVFYKPEMYRNNVSDFLVDEITRATAAETLIAGNLTAETQRAVAAEKVISDAVVAEENRAIAAEGLLDDKYEGLSTTIGSIGGGKKAYTTYAKMVADKNNIAANSSIDVTNDTDPLKNGTYSYDGAVFAKSDYDPLAQAKSYTDTATSSAISTAAGDATTKANTAKSEAISASATDATTKANTAKSEAIADAAAYTDEKISKIDLETPVLTGQEIYDKALIDNTKLFSAIWSEYNKPVWHVGAGKFVDAVGATVSVVKEELVFTIKATTENQSFYFPTGDITVTDPVMNVDWGDGTTSIVTSDKSRHDYTCAIGDEFTLTCTGYIEGFVFLNIRSPSAAMIKSIDKNTLPKTMGQFSLAYCSNLERVCDGAFNSYAGTNLNLLIIKEAPNLVLSSGMFKGLSNVTNIDNLISGIYRVYNGTLPNGLFDPFINVTSARECLVGLTTVVPTGLLDKMTKLEDVHRFLGAGTGATLDSNLFKNQKHLKDVSYCFSANKSVADASVLYTDMVRGNPSITELCFATATNMTNRDSVPAGWK